MWGMNPQQQAWWQHFLQTQNAYHQAMMQQQMQLEPTEQSPFGRFNTPLLGRRNVLALSESDPNAALLPYIMGMMRGQGGGAQGGGGVNPMMWSLMTGGGMV